MSISLFSGRSQNSLKDAPCRFGMETKGGWRGNERRERAAGGAEARPLASRQMCGVLEAPIEKRRGVLTNIELSSPPPAVLPPPMPRIDIFYVRSRVSVRGTCGSVAPSDSARRK